MATEPRAASGPRRVAIIGAGASGLASARALRDAGDDPVVLESGSGLGGVWAETREYPGLAVQNTKPSYSYSDLPMPDEWPEQPTAAHMREYLTRYATLHDLLPLIRYGTAVVRVRRDEDGWLVRSVSGGLEAEERFDAVVVASGVFSSPHVPEWPGRAAFEAAGGRVLLPAEAAGADHAGRDVVVIGWGKTACDLAVALHGGARSLVLVARTLTWKTPHVIRRLRMHELITQTRVGEWALYSRPTRLPRQVYRATRVPARLVRTVLARAIERHHGLAELGLRPVGHLSNVSSQVSAGLYEAVRAARVAVRRDVGVVDLGDEQGPVVVLDDGERLRADLVVLGTGYRPRLEFLDPAIAATLADEEGVLSLRRFVHPEHVPGLYFVGWTQNISGLLTAEIGAVWAAAHLAGRLGPATAATGRGPGPAVGHVPGNTLADLDAALADLGAPLPRRVRVGQWFTSMRADQYAAALDAARRALRPPGARGT